MPARPMYSPIMPQDGDVDASDANLRPSDGFNNPATPPQQTAFTPSNNRYTAMANPGPSSSYTHLGDSGKPSEWLEKQQSGSRRSKLLIVGALIALAAVIGVGVGVGVSLSNKNRTSTTNGNNSNGNSNSNSSNPVTQSDPNDPSTFQKDPRLIQSFYGIAYEPNGVIYPACGAQLSDVITDIQLMSQLTKVDMQVTLAIYIDSGDWSSYARQKTAIQSALQTWGTSNVAGITVGNEFMLNWLTANGGGDDPNSAIGNQGANLLIVNITDTRNWVKSAGYTFPIGNSDAGSYFNNLVLEAVDYGMANVHPWFANVSVQAGPQWTWDFFNQTDVSLANTLPNKPDMSIAEVGWPTASKDLGNESNGPSNASEANLQLFLDTFVCQTNQLGIKYYFFEFFDEEWKDVLYGGVEGHWGLFYQNKTLKVVRF
ncbi:glycoside hydrolase [Thelephora terrestris]|uniref:glucan endo-1,3-beta-D-glucosidase n=1 Tax=Thelephora terrestris TaxID=56493 RepID=A0A9P6H471_9AGAM|nr:glycoside hydrolase [Thelephora terrestris]